jgi:hypothetical protein
VAPGSAREPLPQQGDYKDDDADHHSDRSRFISLFRHSFRYQVPHPFLRPCEKGFNGSIGGISSSGVMDGD